MCHPTYGEVWKEKNGGSPIGYLTNLELRVTKKLVVTLPPVPIVSQLKEILQEPLQEILVAPGEISPTIDSIGEINTYVKKLNRVSACSTKLARSRVWKGKVFLQKKKELKYLKYASIQRKWRLDKGTVAKWVLDGKEKAICPIPRAVVLKAYRKVWEREDRFSQLGLFDDLPAADNQWLGCPISPAEVLSALGRMRLNSAAGPDGVRRDPKGTG